MDPEEINPEDNASPIDDEMIIELIDSNQKNKTLVRRSS
jgi:hypothetical protein